jgi:hypothetical protein
MTATIYARVDADLKRATDAYAADRGMSLAAAVSDLVGKGLAATDAERASRALNTRVRELEIEISRVRDAANAIDDRLHQRLDLLVTGRCANCARGITGLLTNPSESGGSVDRSEFAPFLAGIGVTVALIVLAYAASQN